MCTGKTNDAPTQSLLPNITRTPVVQPWTKLFNLVSRSGDTKDVRCPYPCSTAYYATITSMSVYGMYIIINRVYKIIREVLVRSYFFFFTFSFGHFIIFLFFIILNCRTKTDVCAACNTCGHEIAV
jgi:hypothetical protein